MLRARFEDSDPLPARGPTGRPSARTGSGVASGLIARKRLALRLPVLDRAGAKPSRQGCWWLVQGGSAWMRLFVGSSIPSFGVGWPAAQRLGPRLAAARNRLIVVGVYRLNMAAERASSPAACANTRRPSVAAGRGVHRKSGWWGERVG